MKYKITFKGGASAVDEEERVIETFAVRVTDDMTTLIGGSERDPIVKLVVRPTG